MLKVVLLAIAVIEARALLIQPRCAPLLPASYALASSPRAAASVFMCDAAPAEEAAAAEEAAPVEAAAEEEAPKKRGRGNKTPLEELEVDAEVEGKIRSVMAYGAFVDIGAVTDGLLHVSEISNEFIQDATEKLTAGETITCRVKGINLEKGQLALTAKDPNAAPPRERRARPDLSEYESADPKAFVAGKVNSITDFGAFITLKEGVDGLVHISQIQEGGVGKVSDVLSVGQEVQVRIEQVDKGKRRIGLSMLPWSEESAQGGGGRKRPMRGGNFDVGFGADADAPFQVNAEELEAMAVGDTFASPFEAAFERAALVQKMKSEKEKFARQVL